MICLTYFIIILNITGLFFVNVCSDSCIFIPFPLSIHRSPKAQFLGMSSAIPSVSYAFPLDGQVLKALFCRNVCSHSSIFIRYLKPCLSGMSAAVPPFSWLPAGFHLFLCPSSLTYGVLEGLFNECLQEFIHFYALQVSLLVSFKGLFNECLQGFH